MLLLASWYIALVLTALLFCTRSRTRRCRVNSGAPPPAALNCWPVLGSIIGTRNQATSAHELRNRLLSRKSRGASELVIPVGVTVASAARVFPLPPPCKGIDSQLVRRLDSPAPVLMV